MPQNLQDTVTYQTIWNLAVQLSGRTTDNVPPKESDMVQGVLASQLEDLWRKEAWPELSDNWFQPNLTNNAFPNPYPIVTVSGETSAINGQYEWNAGTSQYINGSNYIQAYNTGWGLYSPVTGVDPNTGLDFTQTVLVFYSTTSSITGPWTFTGGYFNAPYNTLQYSPPYTTIPTVTDSTLTIGDILGVYNVDPRTVEGWERVPQDKIVDGNDQFYINTCWSQPWVNYQLPCPDLLDPSLVGVANQAALNAVTLPRRFRNTLAFIGASALLAAEDAAMSAQYSNMVQLELVKQASLLRPKWWGIETGKR